MATTIAVIRAKKGRIELSKGKSNQYTIRIIGRNNHDEIFRTSEVYENDRKAIAALNSLRIILETIFQGNTVTKKAFEWVK